MNAAAPSNFPMSRELLEREKEDHAAYHARLEACVIKPGGHTQKPGADPRLYAVTTIASLPRYGGTRTPVVCDSFEAAKEIVETNMGDIYEYSYSLVVIEGVRPNRLYGCIFSEQYWYRWDDGSKRYVAIETPPGWECISGHGGIG